MPVVAIVLLCAACAKPSPAWSWDAKSVNIGMIALDSQGQKVKAAYALNESPCDPHKPVPTDTDLKSIAGPIFLAHGNKWGRTVTVEPDGQIRVGADLGFGVSHYGDLAVLVLPPVDFGGVAIVHPCSRSVLFAGSVFWSGRGTELYLPAAVATGALRVVKDTIPEPETIDMSFGTGEQFPGLTEKGQAAWSVAKATNLIQDLGSRPYSVFVYLYPRCVGGCDADSANWLIVAVRQPAP